MKRRRGFSKWREEGGEAAMGRVGKAKASVSIFRSEEMKKEFLEEANTLGHTGAKILHMIENTKNMLIPPDGEIKERAGGGAAERSRLSGMSFVTRNSVIICCRVR